MNPGRRMSHTEGWGSFIDASKTPNQPEHSWTADWKNSAGDVVRYSLLYESRCTGSPCQTPNRVPDNSRLHLAATWMSAATVEGGKRASRKESVTDSKYLRSIVRVTSAVRNPEGLTRQPYGIRAHFAGLRTHVKSAIRFIDFPVRDATCFRLAASNALRRMSSKSTALCSTR